ncbi:Junctional adhesion molecule-like [Labeo rohita]|uniref:Junctional adhesion molecule-like n=1 Tax=Labeo rohita TaxID=84645 RepID=A0ABQ8LAS3_LABRO|nr:Junctional adhesion molecule-like [Labeo rohita]
MTDRYEIAWFHQYSQQLNQLLSAKISSASGRLLVMYNQDWSHLNVDDHSGDKGITTVMLVISGVTESDSGLYFCGTKSENSKTSKMHFEKPIRLQIEGGVTTKERALMFGGVGLAVLVFFLATVIAGGIIHYRGWQKGWAAAKRSSLMNHKSDK